MAIFGSRTCSRFRSLLDTISDDSVGPNPVTVNDGMLPHPSVLGPSVGDDTTPAPNLTVLGPCVGDDGLAPTPNLTVLGPCVGDDGLAPVPNLTVLGPCVGDDQEISDARLKQDVRRVGATVFGLPLYHFKYLGKREIYEGVMAQDVLRVMPSAVAVGEDRFYRVNYGALGTEMRRVS
jgi:endosialidase-like protein